MDSHALTVLEYHSLLAVVGSYAQTAPGRQRLEALRPAGRPEDMAHRKALYADILGFMDAELRPPGIQFEGIDDVLRRGAPEGAVLDGDDLVRCRGLLDTAVEVGTCLRQEACQDYARLQAMAHHIHPCDSLREDLHRCLDDDGDVLDGATETLRTLRRRALDLRQSLQRRLERMLQSTELEDVIQEAFVTVRNGRFVVPVRREEKGALPGIIHDLSNSGATVFIEPSATVPLGNELADVLLQERDEVRRILAGLSDMVRMLSDSIRSTQDALTELDAAFAVGRWAGVYHCIPAVGGDAVNLIGARHPLLQKQFDEENRPADLVPLNFSPGNGIRTVVITGSNTGGKTVALKTIGLLSLMAQTGLPVPVDPASEFRWFDRIFADIGDEQSLEASLSTFSAHLRHITEIFEQARGRGESLVLLDELGAGTDPLEGGALACAVLQQLAARQAFTVATTHLGVVKQFVHDRERMVNAAVRFNTETLSPEYELDIGRPGASHALLIADRLKLPPDVLEAARTLLAGDHLQLEKVLADLEEDQRRLSATEKEARGAHEELLRNRDAVRDELTRLRKERRKLMHEAYQQAAGIVENARQEMERRLRELREAAKESETRQLERKTRQAIEDRNRKLRQGLSQTAPKPDEPVAPASVELGDTVWVASVRDKGTVTRISENRGKVTVDVKGLPFTVDMSDLGRSEPEENAPAPRVKVSTPRPQGQVSTEVNLIGLRVEEALDALDHFLNRAVLGNLAEVRVIHGFGTGRLRQAIHDWLRQHHLVKEFRQGGPKDPGGGGATYVKL